MQNLQVIHTKSFWIELNVLTGFIFFLIPNFSISNTKTTMNIRLNTEIISVSGYIFLLSFKLNLTIFSFV